MCSRALAARPRGGPPCDTRPLTAAAPCRPAARRATRTVPQTGSDAPPPRTPRALPAHPPRVLRGVTPPRLATPSPVLCVPPRVPSPRLAAALPAVPPPRAQATPRPSTLAASRPRVPRRASGATCSTSTAPPRAPHTRVGRARRGRSRAAPWRATRRASWAARRAGSPRSARAGGVCGSQPLSDTPRVAREHRGRRCRRGRSRWSRSWWSPRPRGHLRRVVRRPLPPSRGSSGRPARGRVAVSPRRFPRR